MFNGNSWWQLTLLTYAVLITIMLGILLFNWL